MTIRQPVTAPGLPWTPGSFLVAQVPPVGAPYTEPVKGWLYAGLGLHMVSSVKARYVRKDGTRKVYEYWSLTHLNSGHVVRSFREIAFEKMMAAATDLAEIADWDFVGLDGWKNLTPDMPDRMQAWHARHGLAGVPAGNGRNESVARSIGIARAG